ncbi:sugar diacid recognition domain-containing protein [Rodentibacter caecimuris]|uniref:XRE family transcriptional regulator n=1 Tax=Rodentibacter caecimuris TaxID=1796644 RepID=A0ABX3L3L5_9PAST|nr:hypothetical protein BKG89_00530 [Rodentibacter heylii]
MKLNKQIAQQIVKRTMGIIHHSINVMDENGMIIASGDPNRLNQKHTGAVIALRQNRIVEIDDELARQWQFEARAGINLPIHYLGKNWGVVGISGKPEQVRIYAELVKMTAELIIEQHILLENARWHHRYKEEFILQLLKGALNPSEIEKQATFFEFDLSLPRTVIIVQLTHSTAEKLQELVSYLEQSQSNQDIAILSLDQIVILKPIAEMIYFEPTKLFAEHISPHSYKVAIGSMQSNQSLNFAYKTALATLDYGLKYSPKKCGFFFHHAKLPILLNELSSTWQSMELIQPTSVLYQNSENTVLRKTLAQYFLSNCDPVHTATTLFIHPNTLRYRLAKIEQLTGLSFNRIDEKFILYLSTLWQKTS